MAAAEPRRGGTAPSLSPALPDRADEFVVQGSEAEIVDNNAVDGKSRAPTAARGFGCSGSDDRARSANGPGDQLFKRLLHSL
jgi:hypothetical protein